MGPSEFWRAREEGLEEARPRGRWRRGGMGADEVDGRAAVLAWWARR